MEDHPVRRTLVLLAAALVGLVVALALAGPAGAQESNEGLGGRLVSDDQPVPGVTITVSTDTGTEVESVETDADGSWFVAAPPGRYRVELDTGTLPSGVQVRRAAVLENLEVFAGQTRTVLFALQGTAQGPPGATPSAPPTGTPAPGEEPPETLGPGEPGEEPDESADAESGGEGDVVAGRGTFGRVLALTYSGIHFGLYIALAALGLSLIFGTMGLVNFAHGELVTFGAIMAFLFNIVLGLPLLVAAVVGVGLGALFGWGQDRWFWGWLRKRGTGLIAMMIVSLGVGLMLRFAFLYFVGGRTRRYDQYVVQDTFSVGPMTFVPKTLIADAVAIAVLVAVSLALLFTRLGKATRAVADNPSLAAASGINVDRIIRLVWAVGAGLAALSGVILAIDQGVHWQMGLRILLLIFAAVILGGLGTAFGALVGSLVVGVFIQLSTLVIPNELKLTGALAILIIVLLVRPQGILGRRERVG
jgi:neutral amino acid transport system permease protein